MDVKLLLVAITIIIGGYPRQTSATVLNLIRDLLQDNLAGRPVIHEETEWDFDPEVGKLRRIQFEAINGWRGSDLIDRLGYGNGARGVTPKTSSVNLPAVILPTWDTPTQENHKLQP